MNMDTQGNSLEPGVSPEHQTSPDVDQIYRESLQHFQNGRWQQAMEGFEAVLQVTPNHAEAKAFLEEARLKASLDQDKPKPKRLTLSPIFRRLLIVVGSLVVIVAIVLGASWAYGRYVTPTKQAQQAEQRKTQQLQEANRLLANREYAAAEEAFRALLTQDPNNKEAQDGLAEAQTKAALAKSYEQAQQAISNKDLDEAERILTAIVSQDATYRDVQTQLERIKSQKQLAISFADAEQAYSSKDWVKAIATFETLRNLDSEYEQATVTEHLFDSYLQQGISLVASTQDNSDVIKQAQALYKKALAIKPQQAQATLELNLANKYLEGETLLSQGNATGAAQALQWIYKQQPDYANGNTVKLLKATGVATDTITSSITTTATVESSTTTSDVITSTAVVTGATAGQTIFQQQYADWMLKGDTALSAGNYALAEEQYNQAIVVAVHGGYNSARWLFAAYTKAGTAAARGGKSELGAQQIKTAITLITKSAVAIPAESYSNFVAEGDRYAQLKDYPNAFAQYSQALRAVSPKCNCGLENWSILP